MNRTAILEQIQKNVERLSAPDLPEYKYIPLHQKPSPSVATLHEIMRLLRTVIFPGFFGTEQEAQLGSIQYYTGVSAPTIYVLCRYLFNKRRGIFTSPYFRLITPLSVKVKVLIYILLELISLCSALRSSPVQEMSVWFYDRDGGTSRIVNQITTN